jgi:hypothetical protein
VCVCVVHGSKSQRPERENDWDELYIIELHCDRAERQPSPHTPYRLVMNVVLSRLPTDSSRVNRQTLRQREGGWM